MSNPFFERPILNSPYERPPRHWELDKQGQPTQQIIESRRLAEFITPIPKGKFGVAILDSDGSAHAKCVDCVDDAVQFVVDHTRSKPAGVGVDAPLWWSSGPAGGRRADQWLRDQYGLSGGEVQAVNSLQGAALVQGAMFVQRMRERFPGVPVTESHPKALLAALKLKGNGPAFFKRFRVQTDLGRDEEHDKRDAVVSAVAAREGFSGQWTHDLSLDRDKVREQDPQRFWLAPIHYYWPDT